MGRKQTRRSISVSGALFEQARAFAEANQMSLAQLAEVGIKALMEKMSKAAEKEVASG